MKSGASKQNGINIFSRMGLIIIGLLCVLYTLFYRYFAQVHIQIPFLKFPIFVGEQGLFVCFILLVLRWKVQPPKDKKIYLILVVYFIWLLIKALHGYSTYGPYALRNAALFYYPIFAVFGFYFYDRRLFKNQLFLIALLVLFLIFFKVKVFSFYRYINVFFYIVLLMQVRNRWAKILFLVLSILTIDSHDIFLGSRSYYLGIFVSIVFLWVCFILFSLRNKSVFRLPLLLISIMVFAFLMIHRGDGRVKSLYQFDGTVALYKEYKAEIARNGKNFVFTDIKSKLYDPDTLGGVTQDKLSETVDSTITDLQEHAQEVEEREKAKKLQEVKNIQPVPSMIKVEAETMREKVESPPIVRQSQPAPQATIDELKEHAKEVEEREKAEKLQTAKDIQPRASTKVEGEKIREKVDSPPIAQQSQPAPQSMEVGNELFIDPTIIKNNFSSANEQINEVVRGCVLDVKTNRVKVDDAASKAKREVGIIIDKVMENVTLQLKASVLEKNPQLAQTKDIQKILDNNKDFNRTLTVLNGSLSNMATGAIKRELGIYEGNVMQESIDQSNVLFRWFIWEDMIGDLIREKAFLGINFGEPQRSRQIEILKWAQEEWRKDGWIAPHNSYLHMVYRAGIIGVIIIIVIFVIYGWMVRVFIQMNSIVGILLTGILCFLMVIAAFLVFLEFPYTAIPFWSLYGMTLAYCVEKRNEWLKQS